MATLTDAKYKPYGKTVLYVPNEGYSIPVEIAVKSKDYVQRLESKYLVLLFSFCIYLQDLKFSISSKGLVFVINILSLYIFECVRRLYYISFELDDKSGTWGENIKKKIQGFTWASENPFLLC